MAVSFNWLKPTITRLILIYKKALTNIILVFVIMVIIIVAMMILMMVLKTHLNPDPIQKFKQEFIIITTTFIAHVLPCHQFIIVVFVVVIIIFIIFILFF